MAFLAETLVDEWLNRQGHFTIRGLKDGVSEIDLLGVRPGLNGLEAWHGEVQASFRPVGYIAPVAKEQLAGFARTRSSAKARPESLLQQSIADWVEKKFTSRRKLAARERAWPGLTWQYVFVHAVVRKPQDLALIGDYGVRIVPFHEVLNQLRHGSEIQRGSSGTYLSVIIEYFARHSASQP